MFEIHDGSIFEFITSVLKFNCILNRDFSIHSISEEMSKILSSEGRSLCRKNFLDLVDDIGSSLQDIIRDVFERDGKMVTMIRVRGKKPMIIPVEIIKIEINGEQKVLLFADNCFKLYAMIENERDKRVKELDCLYNLASELERARSIDELMLPVSIYIRDAMRFSDICNVSIILDGVEYADVKQSEKPVNMITKEIQVRGEKRGEIVVDYLKPEKFLDEEYSLINSISKILGRAVERFEYEKKRDEYTQKLEEMIEERVREVEESRARYKLLYENAPVGICVTTKEGEFVSGNRELYRMFKYPEDGSVKLHIMKDGIYCNLKDREAIVIDLDKYGSVSDREVDMKTSDGSSITVSLSTIKYDENGQTYFESILKDITEKKKLEEVLKIQQEALKEQVKKRTQALVRQRDKLIAMNRVCQETSRELRSSISKMQTLFNAITDPVISIDRSFQILMSNQSDRDTGGKCHEVLFDNSKPCKRCPAIRAIRYRKPVSIEVEKGDKFYLLQCYPILDNKGNVDGVIEWAKDITQEKDICNQMLQADRLASLGQLVSGIGHEINNPNTFILGNMKIIQEAYEDMLKIVDEYSKSHPGLKIARLDYPVFKEHVSVLMDDMVNGASRIKTIVEDLKKFARRNDEKHSDSVSINNIVQSAIRLVQNQVKRRATITTELGEMIPVIKGNGLGLEQVIVNLIINAADAVKDGEKGSIKIKTALDELNENIVVMVMDNGVGMTEATIKQIFNPFFTTKRACGGTGLGLSIAYRIIKEHEGEIEVESTLGEGTVFRIYIPINLGIEDD